MKAIQADFPVRTACRVLRVSPSGYYEWLSRAKPAVLMPGESACSTIQALKGAQ